MKASPLIGIVAHTDLDCFRMPATTIPLTYSDAVVRAGGTPLILPFTENHDGLQQMLAPVDGLLIPGGKDVDPALYHQEAQPETEAINPALDRFQIAIVEIAISRALPLLGICRRAQVFNVTLGGTLHQDVPGQFTASNLRHMPSCIHFGIYHNVTTEAGSRLRAFFGKTLAVNSRHHQAINLPGEGLAITAHAPDGVIEGAQHTDLPIDLVQWHPELMLQKNDVMLPLFTELVERCRQR